MCQSKAVALAKVSEIDWTALISHLLSLSLSLPVCHMIMIHGRPHLRPPCKTKPGACVAVQGGGRTCLCARRTPGPVLSDRAELFLVPLSLCRKGEGQSLPLGLSAGPHGPPVCLSYKALLKTEETIRTYRKLQFTHGSDWVTGRNRDNIQWVQNFIWSRNSTEVQVPCVWETWGQ